MSGVGRGDWCGVARFGMEVVLLCTVVALGGGHYAFGSCGIMSSLGDVVGMGVN